MFGVGFVVDKVTVEQVFLRVQQIPLVSIIPKILHISPFNYNERLHKPSNLKRR
jgi:hypothetical protein